MCVIYDHVDCACDIFMSLDHHMVMTAIDYNVIHQAAESIFSVFDTIDNKAYCSFIGNFLVLGLLQWMWIHVVMMRTNWYSHWICIIIWLENSFCQGLQKKKRTENCPKACTPLPRHKPTLTHHPCSSYLCQFQVISHLSWKICKLVALSVYHKGQLYCLYCNFYLQ